MADKFEEEKVSKSQIITVAEHVLRKLTRAVNAYDKRPWWPLPLRTTGNIYDIFVELRYTVKNLLRVIDLQDSIILVLVDEHKKLKAGEKIDVAITDSHDDKVDM